MGNTLAFRSATIAARKPKGADGGRNGAMAQPMAEEIVRPKLTERSLNGLRGLSDGAKILLRQLFQSPMTRREAIAFVGNEEIVGRHCRHINGWAKRRFGERMVVRESLTDRRASEVWILKVNPSICEADYSGWNKAEHIKLQDVLSPRARLAVQKLAALGWATRQEFVAAGMRSEDVKAFVLNRAKTTNRYAVEKGFPVAIEKTRTEPDIYFVNREFAALFGIARTERIELEKMFSENDLKMLRCLAETGGASPTVLSEKLAIALPTVTERRHRINERCRELGLPRAINTPRTGHPKAYVLTGAFCNKVKLQKEAASRDLATFFSAAQIKVIVYLEQHPFSNGRQIGKSLGRGRKSAERQLAAIQGVCEEKELPELTKMDSHPFRYALSSQFIERFGLEEKRAEDPLLLLTARTQRKLYLYFQRKPFATLVQASKTCGVGYRNAHQCIHRMNELFRQAGVAEIRPCRIRNPPNRVVQLRA